jgi:hypothetical protein
VARGPKKSAGGTVGEAQVAHKAEDESNTGYNQSGNWFAGMEEWLGVPVSPEVEGRPGSGSQLLRRLTGGFGVQGGCKTI